ncbi:MAG: type II toxin-antitoxin system RelE/ParE family toxin [Bacteroidales bacterium]|nr:type II toxin-antitoxin system RelE/ParE family toxin [Bacteroidales bacterium]MBP5501267.1 type II toxin-antitoxin system RelE/ParE family toxin [Bacteroidales bacterium]MBQ3619238.1 type II toxin-antitoxin system RelE/ParE family toxin [Bacteroidales bacterium]MBR6177658.1 type II toxin-antitoxin system RelE/ParE family toxin [Bacteroidales bacterium]
MNIIWSEQAIDAVASTNEYIFKTFGKTASDKFMNKIIKASVWLESNPKIGKIEQDLDDLPSTYRSFVVTKINKIIYRINGNDVFVSVFWDCRRDPDYLRKIVN